jgi:hypothetical protein
LGSWNNLPFQFKSIWECSILTINHAFIFDSGHKYKGMFFPLL